MIKITDVWTQSANVSQFQANFAEKRVPELRMLWEDLPTASAFVDTNEGAPQKLRNKNAYRVS